MPAIHIPNKKIIRLFAETPNLFTVGPFQTTGGWWAPLYIDMRKMYTKPGNLGITTDEIIKLIKKKLIKFDLIAGCATAGIPVATLVAHKLKKPFIYVRKQAKKGGLGVAVEGNWQAYKRGAIVLLIDDAYANGTSKKNFIKNVRNVGLKIKNVIVVSRRGSVGGDRWTKPMKVTAYSFSSIREICDLMLKEKRISPEAWQLMIWYVQYPNKWHQDPKKIKFMKEYLKTHKKGSTKV